MLGGIVFHQDFRYQAEDGGAAPPQERSERIPTLDYTIRLSPEFVNTDTELLFPVFQLSGPGYSGELYADFVKFQNLVDMAYVEIVTGEKVFPDDLVDWEAVKWVCDSSKISDVYTTPALIIQALFLLFRGQVPSQQEMPYPEYLENNLAAILDFMLPLFTVLSFCFIVPPLMKRIVHEKQSGVKVIWVTKREKFGVRGYI